MVGPPVQSEIVVPGYHPEFGYLCPSPAVRRRARLAVISAGIGMLIGAGVVLSLMDRRFADGQRTEPALTAGHVDRDSTAIAKAADAEDHASLVASQDNTSVPSMQAGCKDEGASFLNSRCGSAKKHKAHASRSPAARLATIEIGGMPVATEIGRPGSAGMNGKSAQADGVPSRPVAELPPSSTGGPERAARTAIKSRSHARIRERPHEPKDDAGTAFGFAFPYAQYDRRRDTYHGERNWSWSR
jgi:hypothetical protein